MAELFVNVKNETRNANNERTKFNSSNYSESVAFIEKSGQSQGDEIWAKNKFYQFVPNDTNSEGKVLTKTEIPENSGNAATINSEGDGRGEWGDYLSFEDRFSYGVEWPANSQTDLSFGDPENNPVLPIGNPQLHQTLPIQNEYRACYYDLQNKKVLYWYDPDNWENIIPSNIEGNELYAGKYPAFNGVDMYYTKSGNTFTSTPYTGTAKSGIASKNNLVDYSDSNIANDTAPRYSVMVHTPKFYGKSGWYEKNGVVYNWVRISPMKIAGDWIEIPEMFISAYHATIYKNDTYTSEQRNTPSINHMLVSVQNEDSKYSGNGYNYVTGGSGHSPGDANGYPRTGVRLEYFRHWANNWNTSGTDNVQLINYEYYKWIFYWNYIIEFKNFNCRICPYDTSKEWGVIGNVSNYNERPQTKCGYCNNCGDSNDCEDPNKEQAKIKGLIVPKWRGFENFFGDIWTGLDGIFVKVYRETNSSDEVYSTTDFNIMQKLTAEKLSSKLNDSNLDPLVSENIINNPNVKFIGYLNFTKDSSDIDYFSAFGVPQTNINGEIISKFSQGRSYTGTNVIYAIWSGSTASGTDMNSSEYKNKWWTDSNGRKYQVRKVSTSYRATSFNSKKRAGLGAFAYHDTFDRYFTYFGTRFIVKV